MKSKILTLLFVLGFCGFAFSQADDGVCDPATTINPVAVTPDPPPATACSNGTNVPTFGAASGSLPEAEYVVEINGMIDDIDADGTPATAPVDGDVVCVTAFTFDLAAINDILNTAAGLCQPGGFLDCDGQFGLPGLGQTIADLVAGTNDGVPGLNSLDEALALAGSFGTPINSAADAITALDGVNAAIGGLLGNICYGASATVCYTIDDSDAACADPVAGCTDAAACNFDDTATEDDGTCMFEADACDDGDPDTENDVLLADCTCAGTPTGGGAVCDAVAGEPLADAPMTICGGPDAPLVDLATLFDPGTGGYTDAAGVMDPIVTNYVAVDAAGNIVSVANSGAMIDLSALADGDQVCIRQLVYTQALLDDITAFLDANLCGLDPTGTIDGLLGCPLSMVELAPILDGLNNAFGPLSDAFVCDFLDNQIINLGADPTCVPFVGCAIEAALMLAGADVVDNEMIEIDLVALGLDLCAAKSAQYCVTVDAALCTETMECMADAPTMSIDCTDCGDGTTGSPCTVTDAGDGSANAGEITEYLVIDDAAGTATMTPDGIISVGTLAGAQAAVDGLADGEEVCVTAITHVQTELDAVIAAIEAALAPLGVSLGLPATGNTLAAVYGAVQALAGGVVVDLATIETLIANGAGGMVDIGAALGLPPGLVVADLPPFCYNVDPAVCVTGATCMVAVCDPAISTITADPAVVTSESTCPDGMNLGGGVIAAPATDCPMGSTLEYSTDAGATWSTTLPTYDQMNAITVDTRCVCDSDPADISMEGTVTTVPGMCTATCDPAIAAATAPPVVITSESTCPDGMNLSGGALADATGCPMGSMVQYSVDGGAFSTTLPTYNQTTSETITTQCVCTSDPAVVSATSDVTTTPGVCAAMCSISVAISNYSCDDGGTPDDPADDMVTFDYEVVDNGGTGTTWSSNQGDAGAMYGTTVSVGPIPADGTVWTIMVNDDGDDTCTSSDTQTLFDCAPIENIPTVGEWGLIMLGLLMTITAVVGIRQRREEEAYS